MSLPMLTRIKAQNLLSFGPEGIDLELPPLTVLIGPNGSGKSNLLETVGLLRATPRDVGDPIRDGGGITNWIWQGNLVAYPQAALGATMNLPLLNGDAGHSITLSSVGQTFGILHETIRSGIMSPFQPSAQVIWQRERGAVSRKTSADCDEQNAAERPIDNYRSVLSEIKDFVQFPELAIISSFYDEISLYRRWEFGPNTAIRRPQRTDVKPRPLMEDFSNLGMFLNRFRQHPRPKMELFEKLGDIYSGLRDFELNIEGGTVQIFFTEGEFSIPATRLSDGSLRYLCLLAILLDPEPPSMVCIEEPELGFHPDLIPKLADLLVDASSRCQVIVTTHSDILVDALSDRPESVVVCEKHDGQTSMRRLDRSDLAVWLEKYKLGELWTRGDLGGVRW